MINGHRHALKPIARQCPSLCASIPSKVVKPQLLTFPAISLRLMLWTCASNCDYTCQHVITHQRLQRDPPMLQPVVQYHGKWPFLRFMGMQEPFSVLFSAMNFAAHWWGQEQVRRNMPKDYSLRKFYIAFGYFGYASWIFSMLFHTRDFNLTEKLDYCRRRQCALRSILYTHPSLQDGQTHQDETSSITALDSAVHSNVRRACVVP